MEDDYAIYKSWCFVLCCLKNKIVATTRAWSDHFTSLIYTSLKITFLAPEKKNISVIVDRDQSMILNSGLRGLAAGL